jgi:hypothetical protein
MRKRVARWAIIGSYGFESYEGLKRPSFGLYGVYGAEPNPKALIYTAERI